MSFSFKLNSGHLSRVRIKYITEHVAVLLYLYNDTTYTIPCPYVADASIVMAYLNGFNVLSSVFDSSLNKLDEYCLTQITE